MLLKKLPSILIKDEQVIIGDYLNTLDEIGTGAFGNVYRGQNLKTGKKVAIKEQKMNQRELQEAEIGFKIASIHSPFLLALHDAYYIEETQDLYLIFDLCEGTLENYRNSRIKKQPSLKKSIAFPEAEAMQMFCQVVEGVIWLENNNITHRDIKPENILYRIDEKLDKPIFILSDFGHSILKLGSLKTTRVGTPHYVAPEIIRKEKYTSQSDVWALGLVLHEFLFNEVFYPGSTEKIVFEKVLSNEYKLSQKQKDSISPKTAALLEDMIRHDPKKRLNMEQLESRIKEFSEYEFVRQVISSFKFEGKVSGEEVKENEKNARLKYAEGLTKNAEAMRDKGYYEKFRDMAKEAMEIYFNILGEGAWQTRSVMFLYAQGLHSTKDYTKAKEVAERAVALFEKYSNEDDADFAAAYSALGIIYQETGDYQAARKFYEKAVNINVKVLGENHRETAVIIGNLASTLRRLGDLQAAKKEYLRAMNIKIKLFGENHFETAYIYYNLSVLLYNLKEFEEALKYCRKAKTIWEKHYGPNHERTKLTQQCEARILAAMKKLGN